MLVVESHARREDVKCSTKKRGSRSNRLVRGQFTETLPRGLLTLDTNPLTILTTLLRRFGDKDVHAATQRGNSKAADCSSTAISPKYQAQYLRLGR